MRKKPDADRLTFVGVQALLIAGILLGGCASYKGFEYKPNSPISEMPRVQSSIVVLPFEDGTPEWKEKPGLPSVYNYTKFPNTNWGWEVDKLPPFIPSERWGREFAKELTASRAFTSVQYAESVGSSGADILIRGKVLSASMSGAGSYDYSVQLQAIRNGDGKVLWGRIVSRQFGRLGSDPVVVTQTLWRSMFGEALADLVKELESKRSEREVLREGPATPASEPGESVEEILRKINTK